jgi:biopolymer transport protein ExbD
MDIKSPFKEEHAFPQMTSLIDVMFLLLVFFMLTATFSKEKTKNIELPVSKKVSKYIDAQLTFKIIVNKNGSYEIDTVICSQDNLLDIMQQKYRDKKTVVLILADKNAPFQSIVYIYDVMQFLGITKFTHKVVEMP